MTFVSCAQNFEDVLLWRAFRDVERGRYIDIGAQDPEFDSVSLAFYLKGWRGIHAEPIPAYAAKLREFRPEETVIQAAVADAAGPIAFFELGGLSTGRQDIAEHHRKSGLRPRKIVVPTVGLDSLLELESGDIHWMKIDVEGMEASVLRSWRKSPVRPWVLVVESTFPNSEETSQHLWIDEVIGRGYKEAIFDGLSRFFVHESRASLATRLNRPANVFDAFQITLQHFSAKLIREEVESQKLAAETIQAQQAAQVLELRGRISDTERDLESERASHMALRERSGAERAEAQSTIEGMKAELTADRARLDDLVVRQRETSVEIEDLTAQLLSEREARVGLDSEILKIAELAGDNPSEYALLPLGLRSIPVGAAFAAVKSRLQVSAKELELLRGHAESQYYAGQNARDGEVNFLNNHIAALQTDVAEARARLGQFERSYSDARDRADFSEKERARLERIIDEQVRSLNAVKTEAAALDRRLATSIGHIESIYGSRGGRIASFLRLLPTKVSATPFGSVAEDEQQEIDGGKSPPHEMESALNDVLHVSSLLALNGGRFVDALYRSFLKRAPDRTGRVHFISRLQAGHDKEAVLLAIATSTEAQAIGAPIEGVAELRRLQAQKKSWFSRRNRALEERLNRQEYSVGEAHNAFFDRLDCIQDSIDQIRATLSSGGGELRRDPALGISKEVRRSIKQGISIGPVNSASEFVDQLQREVQSSSEALSLRRS